MKTFYISLIICITLVCSIVNAGAIIVYSLNSNIPLDCNGGVLNCSVKYPSVGHRIFPTSATDGQTQIKSLRYMIEFGFD
jgi:hypothetical protein